MTKNSEFNDREQNLDELLAGYVLGNLDEAELTWLNDYIVEHPELTEEIEQLKTTLNLLPYSLPEAIPKNNLGKKIVGLAQSKSLVNSQFNCWGWIVGGLATLATIHLSIQSHNLRQQIVRVNNRIEQQQELINLLSQSNNRLVSFQGKDGLTSASGSLFIAPESKKAVLALQNLESLSEGQVYRLWAVFPEKKVGCANFTPDKRGKVHLELSNDDLNNANSLLITIESQADTSKPQGNAILTSSNSNI